jgi:hypothetical protein
MKPVRSLQRSNSSFCFICGSHLFLLASVFFLLFHSLVAGYESKEEKRVLILFPGQSDLAAYPLVEKGIKSSLQAGSEFRIEYFIEYMDRYRNTDPTHYRQLLDL